MNDTTKKDRAYLGDGVYAHHDGFSIVLTTSNGVDETNTIFLEPEVWLELKRWTGRIGQ